MQLLRPFDGLPHCLNDKSVTMLLEIVANTSATHHVVRHVVLMLTELANAYVVQVSRGGPQQWVAFVFFFFLAFSCICS